MPKFKPCTSKIRIKSAKTTDVTDVHVFSANYLMHEIYSSATIRRHIVRSNERVVIQNQLIIQPLLTPSFRTCSRIKSKWHLMKLKKISRLYSLRCYIHNLHRAMWRQFAEVPVTLPTALLILNYYVHVSSLPSPDYTLISFLSGETSSTTVTPSAVDPAVCSCP